MRGKKGTIVDAVVSCPDPFMGSVYPFTPLQLLWEQASHSCFLLQRNADGNQWIWVGTCPSCPTASDWLRWGKKSGSLSYLNMDQVRAPELSLKWGSHQSPAETLALLSIFLCPLLFPICSSWEHFCINPMCLSHMSRSASWELILGQELACITYLLGGHA